MSDNHRSLADDIADLLAWLDLPENPLLLKRRAMIRRVCRAALDHASLASVARTADTSIDSDQPGPHGG
jgi:hypothetical protein